MRIKHKREEFLSDAHHRALTISGVFFGLLSVDLLRANMSNVLLDMPNSMNFVIPSVLFAALSVFFLLRGLLKAAIRKKGAMELRRDFMRNGTLCHGKVTAAGGGFYEKGYYNTHHIKRKESRYFFMWESRWWAEIEYYDEIKGTYARHRVINLNRNGKLHHLIGRDINVFQKDQSVYVDFNGEGNDHAEN